MSSLSSIKDETLMKGLQAFRENDLTTQILVPLLKKLGWDKVEFSGGVYEEGKDIICWGKDEIETIQLGVAQVKKYKPTARVADNNSFAGLVTQLCQASEKEVPNLDEGINFKPSTLYCITPYEIDVRTLQTRFEHYKVLKEKKIKIIDGNMLVKLIKSKAPELINKITGVDDAIDSVTRKELNNEILLNVLNLKETVDISEFYCDLDLMVGNISSKFILSTKPSPLSCQIFLSREDWETLRALDSECNKKNFSIIDGDKEVISNSLDMKINELIEKRNNCDSSKNYLLKFYSNLIIIIKKSLNKKLSEQFIYDDFENNLNSIKNSRHYDFFYYKFKKYIPCLLNELKNMSDEDIEPYLEISFTEFSTSCEDDIEELVYEIEDIIASYKDPKVEVILNGKYLCYYLEELKLWLEDEIEKINNENIDSDYIKDFIEICTEKFKLLNKLNKSKFNKQIIDLNIISNFNFNKKITIGIDRVIKSKKDLFIYGEAGAGKTTSLQMYAKNLIDSSDKSTKVIYVPLARLTKFSNIIISENIKGSRAFYSAYSSYLKNENIEIDENQTKKFIEEKKELIILADGLDEVIKHHSWIFDSLIKLKEENNNIQLIITSRPNFICPSDLSYCEIHLLPFDDQKQQEFVCNWLKARCHNEKIVKVLSHLNECKEVKDITRTPLLATILCTLAINNIPLPKNEVRLYTERLRLLFGDYDIAKGSRRIDSAREDLYVVSRKIAYKLHYKQTRSMSKREILSFLFTTIKNLNKSTIELAVNELIDPCNVLVQMTSNSDFGFGHLRYQEHLAATELNNNRGTEIGPLLSSSWWRGSLCLYAQMCDNIDHLMEWISLESDFHRCYENFNAMINARGGDDKRLLAPMLASNLHADDLMDGYFAINDDADFDQF